MQMNLYCSAESIEFPSFASIYISKKCSTNRIMFYELKSRVIQQINYTMQPIKLNKNIPFFVKKKYT